jgi:hypothetical protein
MGYMDERINIANIAHGKFEDEHLPGMIDQSLKPGYIFVF